MNSQNPMIDNNDPRLTAYALGELAPAEVAEIEAAVKSSPELQAVVDDIRQASETISNVFQTEPSLQLTAEQKSQLLTEAKSASNFDVQSNGLHSTSRATANVTPSIGSETYQPSSSLPWMKIAIAAGLASLLIGGGFYFSQANHKPMAAADNSAAGSERFVDEIASEEADEIADQPLLPLSKNQKPDGAKYDNLVEAESLARPPMSPNAAPLLDQPFAQSAQVAADEAIGSKFRPSEMPSRQALATKKAPSMPSFKGVAPSDSAKQDYFADGSRKSFKNIPEDSDAFEARPGVSPSTLARAQQAVNRSILGPLNLTVAAQNSPRFDAGGFGGGAELTPSRRNLPSPAKASRGAEKLPPQQAVPSKKAELNSPATFALQISDQDAKQMVNLLASRADPQQRRKLSFDDLISLQAFPLPAAAEAKDLSDSETSKLDDRADLDLAEGMRDAAPAVESKRFSNRAMSAAASTQPLQAAAAATLATKLRQFTNQQSLVAGNNAPSIASATVGDRAVARSRSLNSTKEIFGAEPVEEADSAADGPALDELDDAKKRGTFGLPQNDRDDNLLEKQQPLSEFDFDYSQVIERLKLNLEIRNRSLPSLR